MERLEQKIKEIISERLGVSFEEILPESKLTEDLGASPVEVADLFTALEEQLGINFEDEEKEKIKTVKKLTALIASQITDFENEEK